MKTTLGTIALMLAWTAGGQAAILEFGGTLTPEGGGGRTGSGMALVTYDSDTHLLGVSATFSGLSGNTTNSHIHCCVDPPGNAGVATMVPTFIDFPSGVTFGSYEGSFDLTEASSFNPAFVTANVDVAGAEAALLAGLMAGRAYLNIHSTTFGGGEIRAILTPIPEPSSALLILGAGIAGLVYRVRRRKV
jgi:hypothetical protein